MNRDLKIGDTGTYINDWIGAKFFCEIPPEVALAWVRSKFYDKTLGSKTKVQDMTLSAETDRDIRVNAWLNKLYVIVGADHGHWIALNNHDGRFSIYTIKIITDETIK